MDDKTLMENLLISEKGVSDLYLHGTIESSTEKVRNAFDCALNKSLQMQNEIYKKMSEKGWYSQQQAQQQQIAQTQQKFSQAMG